MFFENFSKNFLFCVNIFYRMSVFWEVFAFCISVRIFLYETEVSPCFFTALIVFTNEEFFKLFIP